MLAAIFCSLSLVTVVLVTTGGRFAIASALGRKADNFTLNDFYGKSHSLADYKDKKLVVLAFIGTECPVAKAYGERLGELAKKYADKGVQFLGVSSNRQDTITELSAFARLKEQEAQSGYREKPSSAKEFFRKGQVGEWRKVLTRRQVRAVVETHREQMGRFGYLEGIA